jgi:predicted AlkP superfamily phosphohydrolase/phosphomutase
MTRNPRERLLMIAVDACELSLVRSSLGSFPTFARLLGEGAFLPLHSTADTISASVWPTMYSGLAPGDHAISQHIQWDPAAMQMRRVDGEWLYCEPFWYELARAGLGVTTVDVPFTFENRMPSAVEVNNWGSHDLTGRFAANPGRLRHEIRRRFGRHPMGYEIPVSKDSGQLENMTRECVEGAATKGRLSRWLLDTTEWNFFLTVFGECHRAGHILWREDGAVHEHVPKGALLEVYRAVDAALGGLLEGVDLEDTTVVVFSLHGMGPNYSQEHFVRRAMDRINASFRQEGALGDEKPAAQHGVMRWLRESIPAPLQHAVARSVPVQVRDWVVSREVTGGLDWSRTPGFALRSDLFSFIRLNVRGREQQGMLEPGSEAHRAYLDHVTRRLLELRAEGTDQAILRDIVSAQEKLPGARQELLPDLILRWTDQVPATRAYSDALGTIEATPDSGRTGEHRPDGFALMLGSRARQGGLPPLASNADFGRFASYLLGVR